MASSAVLKTLEHCWQALEPLQLPMALMGGLALSAWRYPRATRDVDLLIGFGSSQPEVLLHTLGTAGFRFKRDPPVRQLGDMQILQVEFEPRDAFVSIPVDLLLVNSDYHHEALGRIVPLRLPNFATEIFVLSCEDLVLHKLIAGRMIDLSDSSAVLRANRDVLDMQYLLLWANRLNVIGDLQKVWKEAFNEELQGPK